MSTPDASGAPKYYRSHYNQWCCLHWILHGVTRQIPDRKLLPCSIYDVLTQISNDFQRSLYRVQCRQTLAVVARPVWAWCYSPIEKKQSNLVVRSQAFRSLSSLQRWKADPIFTQVLLLALSFRRHFPLLFFIRHLYLSVTRLSCALNALFSISWVDTPLTADWLQVCFGTQPRLSFLKHFEKLHIPPLRPT